MTRNLPRDFALSDAGGPVDRSVMRRTLATSLLAALLLAASAGRAAADVTAFLGLSPTPSTHSAKGVALGVNLLIVGFELEYANTAERIAEAAPGLHTGMVNGMLLTPTRTQFYLTAGAGFYRERLGTETETHLGTNVGGGVKFPIVGPLRLRLDYRVFSLRGSPIHKTPQRFYAGANLTF
jgi:hypothetical protein